MRIAGCLLAFLSLSSLSPAVLVHRVGAQVVPQTTGASPSQSGSATIENQVNGQKQSSPNKAEDDSSSGRDHSLHLHLRLGLISLGAGYSSLSGPACYPYGPSFYSLGCDSEAFWFTCLGSYPFFAPGYFAYGSDKGEVKLAAEPKGAEVYLDRAYAGTADHLKSMWLDPGAYDLSPAASGGKGFSPAHLRAERQITKNHSQAGDRRAIARRSAGEAMNWKLCVAMILVSMTFLLAEEPRGTEPRLAAIKYPAHAEINGVAIGASLLTRDQVRRSFVSDVNRRCLVVEVAFYPVKDHPLNVSLNDFVLRIKDSDVTAKPSPAKVIAFSLQKKARSDRDVTVSPSYGVTYQSGPGYDPVTGNAQSSGITQTTGVRVGVGRPGASPGSTDKDRSAMEAELGEKGLPEGSATPFAGYIYFPVSSTKKNATRQLEYTLGQDKVALSLP
jgi:hypothetical protein